MPASEDRKILQDKAIGGGQETGTGSKIETLLFSQRINRTASSRTGIRGCHIEDMVRIDIR